MGSALITVLCAVPCNGDSTPTAKVIDIISQLERKMIAKGQLSQQIYEEFAQWCANRAMVFGLELKSDQKEKEKLEARIDQHDSEIKSTGMKVEKKSKEIFENEIDIEELTADRKRDAEAFKKQEKELMSMMSMLKRASALLKKEMQSGSASLLQLRSAKTFTEALRIMVSVSLVQSEDAVRLESLLQTSHQDDDSDEDADQDEQMLGEAIYAGHSKPIIDMLHDLHDKAQKELDKQRRKEQEAIGNFNLVKMSLASEITTQEQDVKEAKVKKVETTETKSVDVGELGVTIQDIQDEVKNLADLRKICLAKVQEFTVMHASRDEELKALLHAKKVLTQMSLAGSATVYEDEDSHESPASLFQLAASSTKVSFKSGMSTAARTTSQSALSSKYLQTIRLLAKKEGSRELAQLASRVTAVLRAFSDSAENPFAKITGMISDMIGKLEADQSEDIDHQEYCDKEMGSASHKNDERSNVIERLNTKIDQLKSKSARLKSQVARMQATISKLVKGQNEIDKIREQEHKEYLAEKEDLDQGLEGIKTALRALKEYYAKESDKGHKTDGNAASNIIGLLEVIESDFSKTLASLVSAEQEAASNYEEEAKDTKIERATKEREVQLKTRQYTSFDKIAVEAKSDRTGLQSELSALTEYMAKLKAECIGKPEQYKNRKAKREAEIAGLKDALETLETDTAFMQISVHHKKRIRTHQFLA